MSSAERNLLCLCEILIDILIQLHLPNIPHREDLLRPHLRRVEDVEIKLVLSFFRTHLDTEFPVQRLSTVIKLIFS